MDGLTDRETWKLLFSLLKDAGELRLAVCDAELAGADIAQVSSLMKLAGFADVEVSAAHVQGRKPQWQSAGAPLRRKGEQKQADNPWA